MKFTALVVKRFISSRSCTVLATIVLFCLNLFSLTGGLILSRQWKRAFLFSMILLSMAMVNWLVEKSAWRLFISGEITYELPDWHFYGQALYLLAVVIVVLIASFLIKKKAQSCNGFLFLITCIVSVLAFFTTYQQGKVATDNMLTYLRQGGIYLTPKGHELHGFHRAVALSNPTL